MFHRLLRLVVAATVSVSGAAVGTAGESQGAPTGTQQTTASVAGGEDVPSTPSQEILDAIAAPMLRALAEDALTRSPRIAAASADALAADQRAPQVKALPDPTALMTLFLLQPQTRVGPQQAMVSLSQKFPWFGKLQLKEQRAVVMAAASHTRVEALRLELLSEIRRLYYELAFLDREARVVQGDRAALNHFEEVARARYASGVGLDQAVVKLQAEITRDDVRLLEIATRRQAIEASVNALRDRPDGTRLTVSELPRLQAVELEPSALRARALENRPELAEAALVIQAAELEVELAKKDYKPDVTLGLSYTLVGKRSDTAGELIPPEGNGQDILAITGGLNLPLRRNRLAAGVEEAVDRRLAAERRQRTLITEIDGTLGDLTARIPLLVDQARLYERVLTVQAGESLQSAETAYASGTMGALDLLDAERVLLSVQIAVERVRADHAIAVARLESAIGAPLLGADTTGDAE